MSADLHAEFRRQVEDFTHRLRTSNEPLMLRLRDVLGERGIDPSKCACAGAFDDLLDQYLGVLVLPGEEAIEFCLDFMEQQPRDAVLTYWHTTSPGFYEERILEAHKLLRAERANRTLAG